MGKTKRGKGTKLMAITDGSSYPIAIGISSASPHEVTLVEDTVKQILTTYVPVRIIGDKAYDSDPLDNRLKRQGIELIAPHRRGRVKPKTQDGRVFRRYKRRWKVERLFAWLQQFRRIGTRFDYYEHSYEGFVILGCMIVFLRNL